jgi:hypothetical protein
MENGKWRKMFNFFLFGGKWRKMDPPIETCAVQSYVITQLINKVVLDIS